MFQGGRGRGRGTRYKPYGRDGNMTDDWCYQLEQLQNEREEHKEAQERLDIQIKLMEDLMVSTKAERIDRCTPRSQFFAQKNAAQSIPIDHGVAHHQNTTNDYMKVECDDNLEPPLVAPSRGNIPFFPVHTEEPFCRDNRYQKERCPGPTSELELKDQLWALLNGFKVSSDKAANLNNRYASVKCNNEVGILPHDWNKYRSDDGQLKRSNHFNGMLLSGFYVSKTNRVHIGLDGQNAQAADESNASYRPLDDYFTTINPYGIPETPFQVERMVEWVTRKQLHWERMLVYLSKLHRIASNVTRPLDDPSPVILPHGSRTGQLQ